MNAYIYSDDVLLEVIRVVDQWDFDRLSDLMDALGMKVYGASEVGHKHSQESINA